MKEHFQDHGIRKWAGNDLIELQGEPLEALQKLVEPYAPCILQGCEVTENKDGSITVEPGLVALQGKDYKGEDCVKIARFAGIADTTSPVYLTLECEPDKRVYGDSKSKAIAYHYRAMATTQKPEAPYLEINASGNKRLVDTLGITQKLDREGGNASNVKVVFNKDGTDAEDLKSGNTLAKLFGGIKKWLVDIKATLEKKADSNHTHSEASISADGFMSKGDKVKLNGIAEGADKTTVDSDFSDISTNPVQNKVVKTALDKKAPALVSEDAWGLIWSLGDKVCRSTNATDRFTTGAYGRGGTRTSSEQAAGFLLTVSEDWEYICLVGRTRMAVTIGSATTYAGNNIYTTGEGLYVNVINRAGALKNDYLAFYPNGISPANIFRTRVRISSINNNEKNFEKLAEMYLAPMLVAAATGWTPNATSTTDGFMAATDKTKLDGIAFGAQVNPAYATLKSSGTITLSSSNLLATKACTENDGYGAVGADNTVARGDHKHGIYIPNATTSASGLMSSTDKSNLKLFTDGPKIIYACTFVSDGPDDGIPGTEVPSWLMTSANSVFVAAYDTVKQCYKDPMIKSYLDSATGLWLYPDYLHLHWRRISRTGTLGVELIRLIRKRR